MNYGKNKYNKCCINCRKEFECRNRRSKFCKSCINLRLTSSLICEYCKKEHNGSYATGRFCSRSCSNGFATSKNREEINKKISLKAKGRINFNSKKGTGVSGYRERTCKICGVKFISNSNICSSGCLQIRRIEIGKNNFTHGYRAKSGTRYSGWYQGIYCNSSWELAYILYCGEKGITVERNKESFEYEYLGKIYKYYPDFIVDGLFVEIKGVTTKQDLEKWKQFPHRLTVLDKEAFLPIQNRIVKKYGKRFWELFYEKVDVVKVS